VPLSGEKLAQAQGQPNPSMDLDYSIFLPLEVWNAIFCHLQAICYVASEASSPRRQTLARFAACKMQYNSHVTQHNS